MRHAVKPSLAIFFQIFLIAIIFGLLPYLAVAQTLNNAPDLPQKPYVYFNETLPEKFFFIGAKKEPLVAPRDLLEPHKNNPRLDHIVTLGRVLFYDRKLSANGLVSCASCHKQEHGFDDISRRSIGFKGKPTARSAMGLAGARFSFNGRFFWDERAETLEDQVLDPFTDPIEMGLKEGELVRKINAQTYYRQLFFNAFGENSNLQKSAATALSLFVMAIGGYDSAFDRQITKHKNPLSEFEYFSKQQNRGKFLFFTPVEAGGAGCSQCHSGPHFLAPAKGSNNGLDLHSKDQGVGGITKMPADIGKFRPPSLRNISARAPYMHDGRFKDLAAVIDHYSEDVISHPNLDPLLKDKSGGPILIGLSLDDKEALIEFLGTLTDFSLSTDERFSNPFLSQ